MFSNGALVRVRDTVNAYPNKCGRVVCINEHGLYLVQFHFPNGRRYDDDYVSVWYKEDEIAEPFSD